MAFTDLKKEELVAAAKFYSVETDLDATKANIAMALLDEGVTPEDWERDGQEWRDAQAGRANGAGAITTASLKVQDENEVTRDSVVVETEDEPDDDGMVLVRFVGRNASYRDQGVTFSANRPFALLTKDQFEALDRKKFREATKAEGTEFFAQ